MLRWILSLVMFTCLGAPVYVEKTFTTPTTTQVLYQWCDSDTLEGVQKYTITATVATTQDEVFMLPAKSVLAYSQTVLLPPTAGTLTETQFTWEPHAAGDTVDIIFSDGQCYCNYFPIAPVTSRIRAPIVTTPIVEEFFTKETK